MLYRGRGLRPFSYYERRRNPRYLTQDVAFQPVEAEKKEQSHKEVKQESAYAETQKEHGNSSFGQSASDERLGTNNRCPHIFRLFNIDIFLDDLILLGLIFLLLQESHDDYIFIFALIFLFLIGKE